MRRFLMSAAALACCSAAAMAAEPEVGGCLALEEALALAAARDPRVNVAEAGVDEAAANLADAWSLRRPQLSAFARTSVGDDGLADNVIENQVGLRASQRLLDFGDARFARRQSREALRAAEFDVAGARVNAGLETGLAYLGLLEAQARLETTKDRADYFTRQLAAVEGALARGGATVLDRAEVAAALADARALILELQFARDRFATRLNLDTGVETPACPVDPQALGPMLESASVSAETVVERALSDNPQIQALDHQVASLRAGLKRERAARLPTVDLVGIVSYAFDENDGQDNLRERLGVDVSAPIFSGDRLGARSRRAQAQLSSIKAQARTAERRLREDVTVAQRRMFSLEAQARQRDTVAEEKAAQFAAAQREHAAGRRTLPDLVEVRLEFEDAAFAAITTRFDFYRQTLQLRALTGGLAFGDVAAP